MGKGRMKQAMELAGSQHKYQIIVLIVLSACWILANFIFLSSTYILMDPVFHCKDRPGQKYHQIEACPKILQFQQECQLIAKFTLTSSIKLYCQKQSSRIMIQSISPLGSFMGLIILNLLSDTKGRKFAFLVTILISLMGVILLIHGGLSNNVWILFLGQFILGFGSYSIFPIGYTLIADFFSDKLRPIAVVIINSVGGFGPFMIGVFYLFELNWYYYLLLVILVPLVVIAFSVMIFFQQSPYILMNQNKQDGALKVLQNIAIQNNKKQNFPQIRRIIQAQSVRDSQSQASLQNVYKKVKQWKYFKSILILTIIYGIGNLNWYGISYSFQSQGLGFGYNSIIAGLVQMGSFVFLNYTAKKFPRRLGMAGFYTGVMIIGLSFLIPSVKNSLFLSTFLLAISRIFSSNAYGLFACMQTQAFTVSIQSTAAGIIQAFALYGALIAPSIVSLANHLNIDPIAMVAIFVNFAIWPNYFLRQTFGKDVQKQGKLLKHLKKWQQMSDVTDLTSVSSSSSN